MGSDTALQTGAAWDFLEVAYRKGLLDESMRLLGMLAGPDADLSRLFEVLEEKLDEVDLEAIDRRLAGFAVPLMQTFSEEETVEGMKVVLEALNRMIEASPRVQGEEMGVAIDGIKRLAKALLVVGKAGASAAPIAMRAAVPDLVESLHRNGDSYGRSLGRTIGSSAALINEIHSEDPLIIPTIISGAFRAVEGGELGKAARTIMGSILEMRPPLIRTLVRLPLTMIRERFSRKKGGL